MAGDERGAGDDREADGSLPEPLLDVVADPEQGRHRLPYLLGLLDGDDHRQRLTASTAVCLVVDRYPDMLGYVVERLVDRLDDDAPVEVGHTLDYLAARNPKAVDEAVNDLADEREVRARQRLYQSGAGFARSEYLLPTPGDRPVGRTRVAGGSGTDDPRRVRTTDAADRDQDESGTDDAGESVASDDSDGRGREETQDGTGGSGGPPVTRGTLALVSQRLSAVVERSAFDDIDVLTDRRRGRYGDVYRAVGTLDEAEYALALTVFRLPDEDREPFLGQFRAAMERWDGVDDHDRVLSVHDWGLRPRPWATLEYTDLSLADRDGASPGDAGEGDEREHDGSSSRERVAEGIATTLDVADALAHAHQHGVVHGAVDPQNVRVSDTALTDDARRRSLLAYPGLTAAYAGRAGVGEFLDPRYAPPEYYDDSVGAVDHATDVYALGLLLYRLCTGRHAYEGSLSAVREAVLAGPAPHPSTVEPAVPRGVDQVVEKATARGKLTRYETVNAFRRELRSVENG